MDSPVTAPVTALSGGKRCPRCGRTYPAEFSFCQDDAAALVGLEEAPAVEAYPRRLAFIGLAGLAALVLLALVLPHVVHRRQPGTSALAASAGPTNAITGSAEWRPYRNVALGFSMDVPAGWPAPSVEDLGRSTGDGHMVHVTFRPAPDVTALVAVDLAATGPDARAEWRDLDGRFRKVYKERYRLVSLEDGRVDGRDASTWRFRLQKKGQPLLERLDVGTMAGGQRHAFLFLAPPDRFPAWEPIFRHMIDSIRWDMGDEQDEGA